MISISASLFAKPDISEEDDFCEILIVDECKYLIRPIHIFRQFANDLVILYEPTQTKNSIRGEITNLSKFDLESATRLKTFGLIGYVDLQFAKFLLVIKDRKLVTKSYNGKRVYQPTKVVPIVIWRRQVPLTLDEEDHEQMTIQGLIKEFIAGNMYYSHDLNLTVDSSALKGMASCFDPYSIMETSDRFFWNQSLLSPVLSFEGSSCFVVPLICGHVGSTHLQLDAPSPVELIIISRISKRRPATRYWRRGLDEEGNAAMEAETDIICINNGNHCAFNLLRGSIPLLWDQHQIIDPIIRPRVRLDSSDIAMNDALRKHFQTLMSLYPGKIEIIDIIDLDKAAYDIKFLSSEYQRLIENWNHDLVVYSHHKPINSAQAFKEFERVFEPRILRQGFLCAKIQNGQMEILRNQDGIFRVNSLDCVDETAVAQFAIAYMSLKEMLKELGVWNSDRKSMGNNAEYYFRNIWAENSDALSNYYTVEGTQMRAHSIIRNSLGTFLVDLIREPYVDWSRTYLSHFTDWKKQDSRDMALCRLQFPGNQKTRAGITQGIGENSYFVPSVQAQIYLRRRLVRYEHVQRFPFNLFLVIRRAVSPLTIKGYMSFVTAMIWLFIYYFGVRVMGISMNYLSRKPKELIDIDDLPDISSPIPHGLELNIRKWRNNTVDFPDMPKHPTRERSLKDMEILDEEDLNDKANYPDIHLLPNEYRSLLELRQSVFDTVGLQINGVSISDRNFFSETDIRHPASQEIMDIGSHESQNESSVSYCHDIGVGSESILASSGLVAPPLKRKGAAKRK